MIDETFQGFKKSVFEKFAESTTIADNTMHRSGILRCIYSERFERFFIVHSAQNLMPGFQILRAKTEISKKDLRTEVSRLYVEQSYVPPFGKAAMILDMDLNQKSQMLGIVSSDGRIFFY